jgi:DNA polymerase III epsilon subunit-like protein
VNNKNSVDNQIALIRSQVHSLIHQENANVPAERMVTVRSAFSVVKRSLNETRDLPFEVREYRALRELSAFITLAQQNKSITAFPKHTDLLPVSHPASTARHAMTASAFNYARMQWSLAGTQISEEVRAIVASAVLATPGSIEQKYAITRLSSLPNISLEALLAALGDGNSRDSLSRRAMLQRRDRKGRFAYQGGGGSGLVRLPNGEVQRLTGKPVSQSADGNTIRMELPDGRLVDLPMGGMEFVRAVINPTKDGYSGVPATYDSSDEVVDQDSLQYFDAPHGFRADGDYTADPTDPNDSNGKKYTDDAYDVVVKDNGDYLVSRRGSDGAFAAVDSWSEAQKAIQVDEPSYANQQGMQPIARLSDEQIAKMYDDPDFDAFDIPNPLGEEAETKPKTKDGGEQPPQGPQKFAFTYPENAFKLSTDPTDFEPEGYQDQDSSNYTDDPKVLASKFKLEGLIGQLKKSILPKEDGSPATAYAPFPFNEGPELVPSEAIYAAIGEKGGDPQLEVAKIYDEALGGTANQDALEASRAKPVSEPIATLPDEAPADEPNPEDIADAISSGDLTEEEIQAMLDGEAIGDADVEGDAPEEIKSKKAAKEVEATLPDTADTPELPKRDSLNDIANSIEENAPYKVKAIIENYQGNEFVTVTRESDGKQISFGLSYAGQPQPGETIESTEYAWNEPEGDASGEIPLEIRDADGIANEFWNQVAEKSTPESPTSEDPSSIPFLTEKLPEIGGGWEPTRLPLIYDDGSKEYREVYVKELPNGDKLAFRKDSDNTYVIYSVDSNGNLESSPRGLTYLSWKDFQTDEASPEKFDQLSAFISQNRQNLVRARLSNKLATLGFDQSVVDLAKTGTPEKVKAAIEADPAYASLKQAHETYIQSTAINTSQANAKGAAAYNSINEEIENLKPNLEVSSPEENAQAIESASIPEMNVAPKSSSVKVTVAASDLQEGDITFQEENPKYSGGVLKEPFNHYFVIEEVFTDENTPEGKVNVRGYYPGHQSQVRDWNKDTPISAIRGEFLVPLQGDKPGIERPKQSEEKYAKNEAGKLTPEGRAQWQNDISEYIAALKDSASKYSDPVTDYIDAPQAPENAIPEAPKKPWKAPDAPAFQGDKLVALVKEADGDPEKLKELLDNETVTYFDFETDANSFDADKTQPVQIAAHKIKNGEIVDSFMMFMNPGTELGVGGFYYKGIYEGKGKDKKFIPELDENGNLIPSGVLNTPDGQPITNEWLATQPSREEIMAQFFDWMGADPILAGHNSAGFDEPILRQQALDLGVEYGYTGLIDTLSIARSIDPGFGKGKHTLGTLTEKYGVELDNWHDASADSMAVKGILDAMLLDMKNNNVGMDQMDPDAKTEQYLKELEKYENDLQAYKDYTRAQEVDSLVKDGLEGKDLPSVDEIVSQNTVSDPIPVEGIVNSPEGAEDFVKDVPTPPLSKDSAEWVMDDNNTTLIERKIRPDDFQVGDFIPSKLGGYHEVLDIEEDVDNPNQLKIKTRIVGTDKEYDKTWFRYNKNFDGVRRPNGVVDNITDDLSDAPLEYNISDWNFVKDLGGSNGAGLYEDKNGNQFVVKVPKSEKHAANEVLASEFYEEAGIKTGRVYKGKNIDGETVLVSPFLEGSQETFGSRFQEPEVLAEAQKGFAVDAWLNNYDAVGLVYDNMVMVGDVPVRVDPGGALLFRAQGKDKADQLTPEVTQIDSLRDSNTNAQAASVYGSMTDEQLAESAQMVANITPEKINELVDKAFPDDAETASFLKERLISRRENLIERFNLGKTSEPTTYEDAEQDQKDLGLQPAIATPSTVAPFKHDPDTVVLDPTGDLETQIADAISSGRKVAFYYNDKERLVTPKNMWTNPKYGHVNLRATDEMGVEKNYTLDKIFMSFGESASDDLGVPTPPVKEVLPSEDLGTPQQPSDLDAGTPKPVNEVIAMGEVIKGEYPDAEVTVEDEYFRVTLDSGAMVTVLDQGNGKFEVIAYESWDEDGDSPVDVGSYNNLRDATNALRNTVKAIEAGQDADLPTAYPENSPISDIVAGVFDGTETEVPSVDEIVADVIADDPVKNPITDPNLIFESIKKQFPDNIELPNGDLVVRRKTVVKDGVSYNYDTVVRRNANETFSVYIRETNLSDNSSRVFGYKRAVHSDQALKNQINKITKSLDGSLDPQKWMKSKKAVPEVNLPDSPAGDPIQEIADDLSSPEFPKTEDTVVNALLDLVANSLTVDGTPDKALEALKNFPGISQETVDRVSQIVSDTLVKKPEVNQTDTPNTTDSPYVSADGKTPVKVGDKVFYAKDGKVGVVTALIKAQVTQAGGFGDYAYSDYVKVQFPGDKKPKTRNTKFLSIQNGEEAPTPTPAPISAPEPETPKTSQEDLNDVSSIGSYPSTGIEKAAVTPSITNPDVGVYINANNDQVNVPMTSYGDASFLNNRSPQSVLDTEVPVGALLVSTTSEGQTQVLVVTDNLQNIAGGKPGQGQITVVGRFEGGHSKMTIMTSSKSPKQLKVYLPNDGGNGGGDADIEPINPSDSLSTVEEVSDIVDSISAGIKNDPNLADKVNTDAMDSAVDSASEALNPASNPDFEVPTSAVDQAWVDKNLKDYVPIYLLGKEDLKVGDIIKEGNYTGGSIVDIVITSTPVKDGNTLKVVGTILKSSDGTVQNPNFETAFWGDAVKNKIVLRHKTLAPENPFAATPPVTPEQTKDTQKKSSKFINLKKVNAGELKVGDVVTRKVGKLQYQILAIKPHPTNRNNYQVIYRTVAVPGKGYADGTIKSDTWHETGFGTTTSGYTTKRPKPEWFADALKEAGLPEKPKASAPKSVQGKPGQKAVFESVDELKAYGVDKVSQDFLDYFGADSYDEYKTAMSGYFVKDSSNKYLMPGMVVSDSEGNSGIVVDSNAGWSMVDVSWVVGPKASNQGKETVDGSFVSSNATFVSKETAKDMGVNISPLIEDLVKTKINEAKEAKAKAAALKAEEDKKKAEYAKLKNDNTVSGSGASPVEVEEPLDWSESEYEEVPSLTAAMSLVKTDVIRAQNGVQILVDSDSIEDNLVRVHRVKDENGEWKTRVRFKLTNWAATAKIERILDKTDPAIYDENTGMKIPMFERTPEGLEKTSDWEIWAARRGTTYSIELPNGEGFALIHRSDKTADTPDYTVYAKNSDKVIAFNNEVDIYLPDNATPEQIQDALSQTGVQASRPASSEDVRIMAENKIIAMFGKKGNGAKNYSGELRTKILEDAKEKYGVDASEVTPEVMNNGDVTFVMPQDVANKIAETIDAKYFTHTWTADDGEFTDGSDEDDANFLFKLLTDGGLKSTVDRWTSGINTSGESSYDDINAVGGNYVFTHMGNDDSRTFVFDLMSMLRRLDFYANNSDYYGKKSEDQSPIEELQAGAYEIMFKGTISWADLSKLNVSSEVRDRLLELLTNAGVKYFGDTPVEAVLGIE